jgi:muramidase (phage lysozyme)
MINTTWDLQAKRYHPHPDRFMLFWINGYNFAPEYQDRVVYAWLSDRSVWNHDIPQLLREGKFSQVQKILSPTWTSLGYGIENNPNTPRLPKVYQEVLQEELTTAK